MKGLLLLEDLLFLQKVVGRDKGSTFDFLLRSVQVALDCVAGAVGGDRVTALSFLFDEVSHDGFIAGVS